MKKNKLKQMFKEGKPIINGWLQIPSAFSAEVMAHQGWDSCTIDMQHGVIDYSNALNMLQAISTTDVVGITTAERRPERVYMPNHPSADDDGFVYAAAVNVEEEFVEMLEAKRQYQNNIEVVTTLRALMMRTINMGK